MNNTEKPKSKNRIEKKKPYNRPQIQIIEIEVEEVICASGETPNSKPTMNDTSDPRTPFPKH